METSSELRICKVVLVRLEDMIELTEYIDSDDDPPQQLSSTCNPQKKNNPPAWKLGLVMDDGSGMKSNENSSLQPVNALKGAAEEEFEKNEPDLDHGCAKRSEQEANGPGVQPLRAMRRRFKRKWSNKLPVFTTEKQMSSNQKGGDGETSRGAYMLTFPCGRCEEEFKSTVEVVEHMDKHHGIKVTNDIKQITLPQEDFPFKTPFSVSVLTKVCYLCKRAYHSLEGVQHHIEHCEEELINLSNFTQAAGNPNQMNSDYDVKGHLQTIDHKKRLADPIKKKSNTYICSVCKKSFPTSNSLHAHNKSRIHKERAGIPQPNATKEITEIWCDVCQIGFDHPSQLRIHQQFTSHKERAGISIVKESSKFWCDVCKKSFPKFSFLREHNNSRTHKERAGLPVPKATRENSEHWCDVCEKDFTTHSSLLEHTKSKMHKKRGGVPIVGKIKKSGKHWCDVCKKTFPTPAHLLLHNKTTMHKKRAGIPVPKATKENSEHWCDFCRKAYSTLSNLLVHNKSKIHKIRAGIPEVEAAKKS